MNGGVPQRGNLSLHLAGWSACVDNEKHGGPAACTNAPGGFWDCVPPDFEGNCVIDFEEYNGVWEEAHPRYQNASLKLVRDQHPSWSAARVSTAAKAEFEAAAVEFLAATVRRGKELRPKCKWGYYGTPCAPAACLSAVNCTANASTGAPECGFDDPTQGRRFRALATVVQVPHLEPHHYRDPCGELTVATTVQVSHLVPHYYREPCGELTCELTVAVAVQPVLDASDAVFPRVYLSPNGDDCRSASHPAGCSTAEKASWVRAEPSGGRLPFRPPSLYAIRD